MIYLIEDKTSRRNDYGWTDEKLSSMNELITVVENATQLSALMDEIKEDGNVVLYHESFTQRENQELTNEVNAFLHSIEELDGIYIAYFSGSKSMRKLDGNVCNLHFDPLYTNLDIFIKHYSEGIVDFHYLMFGEHPEIEEKLRQLIQKVNNDNINIQKVVSGKKILCFRSTQDAIQFPISNATMDFCDYETEDKDLINLVEEYNNISFDAIYIPLCMGGTYSDFLGLRLAMFFRLCNTVNKYAHIFIYGVVSVTQFIKFECAEILKMPRVNYILADSKYIINSINDIHRISDEGYHLGLKSIHLNVPTNLGDDHSVANKWGLSRWSVALNDTDSDIEKGNEEIENSLYFRYLSALYPPTDIIPIAKEKLMIEKNAQLPELNILYVDDDADEGWYELLCHILCDENDIQQFDYIGRDMKSKSQEEIISYVMEKLEESNANLVILDFRLHPIDFNNVSIENVTGYKLLKEIKKYNRGIQVIIFSATNKVWNLQALQKEEADGFIMKEAPENSVDDNFTTQSILQFIQSVAYCSKNTYKKELWGRIQKGIEQIDTLRKRKKINKEYAKAVKVLLTMTEDALFSKDLQYSYATAFMNLFRIIEATANEWIEEKPIVDYDKKGLIYSYFKLRKDDSQLLKFNSKRFNSSPSEKLSFDTDKPTLPYFQKICNTLHVVGSYNLSAFSIVTKRNKFTHPNLIENSEIETFTTHDVLSIFDIVEPLIMNQ